MARRQGRKSTLRMRQGRAQDRHRRKTPSLGGSFFRADGARQRHARMRWSAEEPFGPLAPVFRFKGRSRRDREVQQLAVRSRFGISYSSGLGRGLGAAEALESQVGVNTDYYHRSRPFGRRQGKGLGSEGLESRHGGIMSRSNTDDGGGVFFHRSRPRANILVAPAKAGAHKTTGAMLATWGPQRVTPNTILWLWVPALPGRQPLQW